MYVFLHTDKSIHSIPNLFAYVHIILFSGKNNLYHIDSTLMYTEAITYLDIILLYIRSVLFQ